MINKFVLVPLYPLYKFQEVLLSQFFLIPEFVICCVFPNFTLSINVISTLSFLTGVVDKNVKHTLYLPHKVFPNASPLPPQINCTFHWAPS